jgi:hypothetical protein
MAGPLLHTTTPLRPRTLSPGGTLVSNAPGQCPKAESLGQDQHYSTTKGDLLAWRHSGAPCVVSALCGDRPPTTAGAATSDQMNETRRSSAMVVFRRGG